MVMDGSKFDDIAPLYDNEVKQTIEELLSDPAFMNAIGYMFPSIGQVDFSGEMRSYNTKRDFQTRMISPFVWGIARKTTTSLEAGGWENIDKDKQYLYMSNHRDIVLDAGFLNIILDKNGFNTTEIAIGDNLLVYPWIKQLVRLNKSFVVQRDVSMRQMLEVSKHLSEYIHYAILEKKESIWLAQREGRAKDSNDRTQESLLKMVAMYPENGTFIDNLKEVNIIPLSISYEYDPCDFLKAQEFQLKRDNPEYKKTQRDDLFNMETGLLGFKGEVYFYIGRQINDELEKLKSLDRKQQLAGAAKCVDDEIHRNYKIFPNNYIAYDLLEQTGRFSDKYTQAEKEKFEAYLRNQIDKITIPDKDFDYLWQCMLTMYANILKNHLAVKDEV